MSETGEMGMCLMCLFGRVRIFLTLGLMILGGPALGEDLVDSYVKREMELNSLPGVAIAVVRDGRPDLVRAYGLANAQTGEPLRTGTLIELASVSKTFTGLALLKLIALEMINQNDLVVDHLAELKDAPDARWRQLRIQHLVRQRSGLRREHDFRIPCCGKPGDGDLRLAVEKLKYVNLTNRPGRTYRYANSNYVLLAAIIQRVSGLPFPVYLDEQVLQPLGLDRTTVELEEARRHEMAMLHEWRWGRVRASPSTFLGWYGSSRVKSAGTDMRLYLKALLARDILEIRDWRSYLQNRYDFGWRVDWAADWLDRELVLEHGGNLWGVNTAIALAPGKRAGVAVLINLGTKRARPMARSLLRYASGGQLTAAASVPLYEIPDVWATGFVASAGAVCAASVWYFMKLRRRRFEGRRRSATSAMRWGRALLMGGLAGYLPYALYTGEGPPLVAMPASIQVALPPLVWSVSALLVLVGVGGLLSGDGSGR